MSSSSSNDKIIVNNECPELVECELELLHEEHGGRLKINIRPIVKVTRKHSCPQSFSPEWAKEMAQLYGLDGADGDSDTVPLFPQDGDGEEDPRVALMISEGCPHG